MIGDVTQPISSPVLVGRAAELARLASALDRAAAGEPCAVMVAGEAGVGKTRLLTEFARHAEAAGGTVLTGGCLDVGEGTLLYAPVVEALRSLVAALDRDDLERVLGGARRELSRLVPELGGLGPEPVATAPSRLFELLLGVLHRLAERGPVVIVIEDLHWADRSTRDLVGFLVRNLRGGVALVLSYRTDELHRRHPMRPFLAELERSRRVERVSLARLTRRALADLVAGILGRRPPARLVADLLGRSQGNPFFAEELLAARSEGADLRPALRDLLLTRIEALSDAAQQVLRTAAVAGSRVDHRLLAAVAAVPQPRLLELLREAVTHHLLVAESGGTAYAFRHTLLREALYDDLLPGERSALHAAYAGVLAEWARPADVGQLAYHWHAAHNAGAALLASVRAGQAAEAAAALAEAEAHFSRALELWEQAPEAAARSPLDRPALLLRTAQAAMLIGETDRAVALVHQGLATVDRTAQPLRAAALLERLGRYQWMSGDTAAAMETLEQAVAVAPAEPASPERARCLAAHAQLLMLRARHHAATTRSEQAILASREVGARAEEGHALNTLGTALSSLGRVDEGIAHLHEARRVAEELGDAEDLSRANHNLVGSLLIEGRAEAALAEALEGREVAERLGTALLYGTGATAHAAEALVLLGRWEQAELLLIDEIDLERPAARPINPVLAHGLLVRALLRLWQGDLPACRADLTSLLAHGDRGLDPQMASPLFAQLARAATWGHEPHEARAAVSKGLALLAGCDDAHLIAELCLAGIEAEAARAEAARARRSAERLDDARRAARGSSSGPGRWRRRVHSAGWSAPSC
jgi:tetratricopeptide (TPR) repeat protein